VLGFGPGQQADADMPVQERQVLNRHAGLRRWSGKEDAYLEALAHFQVQHAGLAQTLAAQGRARRLPRAAHAGAQGARRGRQPRPGTAGRCAGRLEGLVDGDSGSLFPGAERRWPRPGGARPPARRARWQIRAAQPAPADAKPAVQARVRADLQRARRAGESLRDALCRGALDDAALAAWPRP
jgi:hypothetical protein